ncbi:HupE/UreJ family protein [Oceanihabitans sediminis]|uniref:HupE/UreJ family protein n=1 Tax=Oceanihabitans sediminis TaxID=1812012 RepID=A0A368P454_9FLAO|nr:HupE/UreJ family protein [Oceanihabitans sediminis]MDX1279007.1 HupE/UreJ family protein [Oceanihabitans sediminis]MDX1774630.1 HupE/UreJ family protein [Oceanihabitans sediminis]RBP28489.1 HupE/UreJ protein [Oceanihabitans sediminis]RCU56685.1 HupE/UreJ family protein [Oceanihabitans sediminis]
MKLVKILHPFILILCFFISATAFGHGVDENTQSFLTSNKGVAFGPFLYMGAKHMITGYDHLLFLVGVIFFLYRTKEIIIYVSYFTIGHSLTLLYGVMADIHVNAYIIDAIIGLSIVYKGFDNLGGFQKIFGKQPNTKAAILIFGFIHGFGLATKLQEFEFDKDGLFTNLLGFNLGVEIGQFLALGFVLLIISYWRQYSSYIKFSQLTNLALMAAGFLLFGYQLAGYFIS